MNKKGFATSTIVFALLSVFLISISILLVTITNTNRTKNALNEKVVSNIEYGNSSINDIEQRLEELEDKVASLETENITLKNNMTMITNSLNVSYIKPNIVNTSVEYRNGGYARIGNLVIVNITFSVKEDNISVDVNHPTTIFSGLPEPAFTFSKLTAATPVPDGNYDSIRPLFCHVMTGENNSKGRIVISGSDTHAIQPGWSIQIMGVYLTK